MSAYTLNADTAAALVVLINADGFYTNAHIEVITGKLGYTDGTVIVAAHNPRQRLANGRVTFRNARTYAIFAANIRAARAEVAARAARLAALAD